jgi:hypothetical protein
VKLFPGWFRFSYQGSGKEDIIKEHPDIKKQEPWKEVFFSQFIQRLTVHDSLNDQPSAKDHEAVLPIVKQATGDQ